MSVEDEFNSAVARALTDREGDPAAEPTAVAIAVRSLLPVDDVSVSIVVDEFRIPLCASSDDAARAETLQFTAGDGPCLSAIRVDAMIDAPRSRLQGRWPALARWWDERTPFRSATSVPLHLPGNVRGALNLLFRHENAGAGLNLMRAHVVAVLASLKLDAWVGASPSGTELPWSWSGNASRRRNVWIAIGMLTTYADVSPSDALALLRSRSFADDTTLDRLTEALISGETRLDEIA